jgi:hypothetical protein
MRLRKNKTVHDLMTVAATGETGAATSAGSGVSRVVPAEEATAVSSAVAAGAVEISASVVKAATMVAAVNKAAVISAGRVNCPSRPKESA